MIFTIDTVIARAREILQDPLQDRYSNVRLMEALNLGLSAMRRVRPDIPALWEPITGFPFTTSDLGRGLVLPVDAQFLEPLVAYVAGYTELADDEFAVDGRANTLMTRFTAQLTMGG